MQASSAWALKPLADMSPAEFRDWQALLEARTGMVLSAQRRSFLVTNLGARMRELGLSDYRAYYQLVTDGPCGAVEWSTLLDRLTVQETRFFRHPPSFALLDEYLRQRLEAGLEKPWSLWSLGCSSGEEAYSLAITAAEVLSSQGCTDHYGVTATDISLRALAKGRRGLYDASRLEHLDPFLRERYFQPDPSGRWQVRANLAERACFARLNVLELANAPLSGMDVIFCQNLLIYFRRWRRREILNRLAERLVPGGLLVIGVGEAVDWQHKELLPVPDDQVLAFTRKTR